MSYISFNFFRLYKENCFANCNAYWGVRIGMKKLNKFDCIVIIYRIGSYGYAFCNMALVCSN